MAPNAPYPLVLADKCHEAEPMSCARVPKQALPSSMFCPVAALCLFKGVRTNVLDAADPDGLHRKSVLYHLQLLYAESRHPCCARLSSALNIQHVLYFTRRIPTMASTPSNCGRQVQMQPASAWPSPRSAALTGAVQPPLETTLLMCCIAIDTTWYLNAPLLSSSSKRVRGRCFRCAHVSLDGCVSHDAIFEGHSVRASCEKQAFAM